MSTNASCEPRRTGLPRRRQTGLRETHPELTVTTRVEDCPAELTLVDASSDAGMVVVGTRGRGAFEGMFSARSVTP